MACAVDLGCNIAKAGLLLIIGLGVHALHAILAHSGHWLGEPPRVSAAVSCTLLSSNHV